MPCMWCHKTWSFMSYSVNVMGCRLGMMSYVCQVWGLTHLLWFINRAICRYRGVCHLCDDTDTVAVMSNMAGEMSFIVVVLSWHQYGYSAHIGYDVINILDVKIYIEVCNVLNSSCDSMHTEYDVKHIVCVMSYREWVWYNRYPGFDDTDAVDVVLYTLGQMADITFVLPYVLCQILGVWCHECSGYNVIITMVWSHKEWMWCHM